MKVRDASPADVQTIASISEAGMTAAWSVDAVTDFLKTPGGWALIASVESPVGFLIGRVAADEAEIVNLVVRADARKMGAGRALVDAALKRAAQDGAAAVFLEVAKNNDAALALYRSMGFEPVGQRPDYYRGENGADVDAVIMRCLITGTIRD